MIEAANTKIYVLDKLNPADPQDRDPTLMFREKGTAELTIDYLETASEEEIKATEASGSAGD